MSFKKEWSSLFTFPVTTGHSVCLIELNEHLLPIIVYYQHGKEGKSTQAGNKRAFTRNPINYINCTGNDPPKVLMTVPWNWHFVIPLLYCPVGTRDEQIPWVSFIQSSTLFAKGAALSDYILDQATVEFCSQPWPQVHLNPRLHFPTRSCLSSFCLSTP